MCGFAGFIDFQDSQQQEYWAYLTQMGQQLFRRGPDDEQVVNSHPLWLIFRRLSIIDVDGGVQPIWNEDNTMFVVVNGEIYNHLELRSQLRENHHFRTKSDAEIVLHLYEELGAKALEYLNGMFAIALWDGQKQQLFLARDRLGIKPLYYAQVGSQLIFGSTLASLLAHPNTPWHPQFQDLTNLSATTSFVRGINRLAGGHYLLFDVTTKTVTPQCYWNLADYLVTEPVNDRRTPSDYIREYRDLFVDSVKKRLMSDVPVGACFSGGLDSGVIVAVARQAQPDFHCFNICDDNTRENGDFQAAYQLCQQLKLPFHPIWFDPEIFLDQLDFSLETLEYFIWLIDSPKFNLEWIYKHELYRYANTVMPELKVMLLGQGSDEFAGGYSTADDKTVKNWQEYNSELASKQEYNLQRKKSTGLKDGSSVFDYTLQYCPPGCTSFQKEMLMEIYSLQDYNLWHEDRTSMNQSIEARVPFLDHRLVQYLVSIPPQHHPTLFWNKTIIRQMAQEWLPNDFVYRQKSHATEPQIYNRMKYKIVQRIFPEFKQKYIDNRDKSLFKPETMLGWFEQPHRNQNGILGFEQLLNGMAMTIFKELCRERNSIIPGDYLYGRSPLEVRL
ncbi:MULTISPECIES: asparagine synthase (glutamine-hydrolyzing) [Kamptonema]|uniref:asparagine synthase (glutamine-hydrolyzing) n=1 Tax=Kamptonema TaxID=1501433 RepID=UPI0001DAD75C|nr:MULTISPECIES: asparagine synthase (glutamine-hydrolyzing) [Kamptonema]CBN55324.1 putative Asparagine synthase (glutamine-hydrolyzing) [Kamptonema sp. PCC 6506]